MAAAEQDDGLEQVDTGFKVGQWNELIGEDIEYKIVEPGEGPIAELNQLVRSKYVGRLQATGEVFERAEDTGYRIGDSDTTPALELGLRHMRRGEKGLVRCKAKYGFGPIGRLEVAPGAEVAVPADADLEYEIECLGIVPAINPKDAALAERVAEAELKKRHGNGFFHHRDYNRAIRCYQAGIKALDADSVDPEEEAAEAYAAMVKTFCDMSNNLAMALMKLERWKDAKEVCVKVIEVDKDNVKALYRGGMAALRQDFFEEAELALKEAAKLAPQDKLVRAGLQELQRKRAEYIEKEKKVAKAMGGFLLKPAATGIPAAAAPAGAVKEEEEEEEQAEKGKDEEEGEQQQTEEQEEEESQPLAPSPSQTGQQEQGVGEEAALEPAQEQEQAVHPWLAWYMDHYDWFVFAAFVVLPLFLVWPDLMAVWRGKAGDSGSGGGGEF